jgi:transposase
VPRHPENRQLWCYGLEEKPRGFQVLPRRWVVERTFSRGWGRRGGSGQGLRAIAGDRGGHDLVGHEPHHMLRRLVSARSAEMPYEGLMKAALRPFAKQFLEEEFSEVHIQNSA